MNEIIIDEIAEEIFKIINAGHNSSNLVQAIRMGITKYWSGKFGVTYWDVNDVINTATQDGKEVTVEQAEKILTELMGDGTVLITQDGIQDKIDDLPEPEPYLLMHEEEKITRKDAVEYLNQLDAQNHSNTTDYNILIDRDLIYTFQFRKLQGK